MRIIAGSHRGRRIVAPPGLGTRPMLDRVREAIFSTLAPWLPGARVLDLFAGSGSLGLEALSRGAAVVRAVESGPAALAALRRNVAELGFEERCEVRAGDALAAANWSGARFDVVFLDPPYPLMRAGESRRSVLLALQALVGAALAPEGVVVLHVPRSELPRGALPPSVEARVREYGTQAIWYLQAGGEDGAAEGAETEGSGGA